MSQSVGKVLLKHYLPADLHSYVDSRELDKKGIGDLFNLIVEKHPDKYNRIVSDLARVGFEVSTRDGSSVSLNDLRSPIDKAPYFKDAEKQLEELRKQNLPKKQYLAKAGDVWQKVIKETQKALVEEGSKQNNTLCKITKAGARGSAQQLSQTIFSPVLFQNAAGEPMVDTPIKKSYAEGLTLPEYLMASFGARKGSTSTKLAVADSGYFSKNLARATMTVKVEEHDCGTSRGLDVPTSDRDSIGAYLAVPIGGYNKNNEITSRVLHDLQNKGIKDIVVRSPMTCESSKKFHHNAVCQLCAGKRERGPTQIGDYIGITSASGLGEASSQATLCLSEDTEVLMADYSKKKIKDIQVGELIFGADKAGNMFVTEVMDKFDQGMQKCNEYVFNVGFENAVLVATGTHKILCDSIVSPLSDITSVTKVSCTSLPYRGCNLLRFNIVGEVHCYDLEVEHPDHLFVLGNGLIVSNSAKHSSGSASGPNLTSGFDLIKQLANVPKTFRDKAPVAEHDGVVASVSSLPQGGSQVKIGENQYYVPEGFQVFVKAGDHVEAGDVLSQGIVNPSDVVRLKGIGEGRKHFMESMKRAFDEGGIGGINRRNFEVLSKALIDHVRITDNEGLGEHLPNEIVSYQNIERDYQPRANSQQVRPDHAKGKYLEQPVLHYTIGTRLSSKMVNQLNKNKIESVLVNDHPPGFEPEMQRLDSAPIFEPDVFHQLYSTHLQGKLMHAVNTGGTSDLKGPSPIPGLAYGVGFGDK